jgi:hypothetical protein
LNGYLQNSTLQVSRELTRNDVLETGWVMAKGTHLDTAVNNYNSPDPAPGDIQSRRPLPQFARIRLMVTDSNSIFHALQTRYEHRFTRGLSVTASYAWSHMIDDSAQSTNRGACTCQDPRHRGVAERASSIFDVRHRLGTVYVGAADGKGSEGPRLCCSVAGTRRNRDDADGFAVQHHAERRQRKRRRIVGEA